MKTIAGQMTELLDERSASMVEENVGGDLQNDSVKGGNGFGNR